MSDTCRSCGAPIEWVRTEKRKVMPMDPEPSPLGLFVKSHGEQNRNVRRLKADEVTKQLTYRSHFETCPNAKTWKKHG